MKIPKTIILLLTIGIILAPSTSEISYADKNEVDSRKLVGEDRFDTAAKVSKDGWTSSSEAIIVNDSSIVDALSATPFAKAKDAPILLTSKNELNNKTKYRLKSLAVKKVYLIGGTSVLSLDIENQLKKEGISVERISGVDRYDTSIKLAQKLDDIESISEIAVVNGEKGLADAVSIGCVAAQNNMPIILASPSNQTQVAYSFINSKEIDNTYIIGGESVISMDIENKLPNTIRLGGENRNETNAKVIDEFYEDTNLKSVYVAKDGSQGDNQLIDALSVGVLGAKNESPVMLVSDKLVESQSHIGNIKSFATVTQVGGNGNEEAFEQLLKTQEKTTFKVKTVKELKNTLKEAKANDIIEFRPDDDIDEDFSIKSDYAVNVILEDGIYDSKIDIDMPNGSFTNKGEVEDINIDELRKGTITNSGKIETMTINSKNEYKFVNTRSGEIETLVIDKKSKESIIENRGKITTLEVNAEDVEVKNLGYIENLEGSETPEITGNKPLSENLKTMPVSEIMVKDDTTVKVVFTKPIIGLDFKWDGKILDKSKVYSSIDKKTYTLTTPSIGSSSHTMTIIKYGYEDYKSKNITYSKSEDLRGYLESTNSLMTSTYTMTENTDLANITLGKNKTINLNGNTLTFKNRVDFKVYKITLKGNGKIVFDSNSTLIGDGYKNVFMDKFIGSKIDSNSPKGYHWTLIKGELKKDKN